VSDIGFILDVILHGRTGGWIDIRGRPLLNEAAADDRRVRRWTTRPRILCARGDIDRLAAFGVEPREGQSERRPSRRLEHQCLDPLSLGVAAKVAQSLLEAGIIPDDDPEPPHPGDELARALEVGSQSAPIGTPPC
jgi:hypothetical protein